MNALDVRGLRKVLGRHVAVRELSFAVPRGSIFGLIGPNGSGKSTTLRCALGLLRPDAGEVRVLDRPSTRVHELRGRLGVAFDAAELADGLTVRENLRWAQRISSRRGGRDVDDVLALVGMAEFAARRARALSLGQRRRVSIARALLGSPELVVLDEPLSGLDVVGVRDALALFRRLREAGVTLLLSSHRLHEMEQVADHVAVLFRGTLLFAGALAELCGARERLRVSAVPGERARALVSALPGIEAVAGPLDAQGTISIAPGTVSPAVINRALVEGGVEVSELARERRDLQRAFEDLVAAGAPEDAR